jgi:hypothetical protein
MCDVTPPATSHLCDRSKDEEQGSFLKSWLDSHLSAAETINKPLLFEEFGKKLDGNAAPGVIAAKRDPVYQASYEAVEAAVESDRPLLGSLYWKWAVPGLEKGEYCELATCDLDSCNQRSFNI